MCFVSYKHAPKAALTLIYNIPVSRGASSCPEVIALGLLSSEREEIATFQFKTNKNLIT